MEEKKLIIMSPASFSLLLYESIQKDYGQEGFLIGEYHTRTSSTTTDNDPAAKTLEKSVHVHGILPCPQNGYFYNGEGHINMETLQDFIGKDMGKMVGWYRCRNLPENIITFRDKIIHNQLMHMFNIQQDMFTFILLGCDHSKLSVCKFKQKFVQYSDEIGFFPVKLQITNLGNLNYAYHTPRKQSEVFTKILDSISASGGSLSVQTIEPIVQQHLDKLTEELGEKEQYLHNLEKEVQQLQKQIRSKHNSNKQRPEG